MSDENIQPYRTAGYSSASSNRMCRNRRRTMSDRAQRAWSSSPSGSAAARNNRSRRFFITPKGRKPLRRDRDGTWGVPGLPSRLLAMNRWSDRVGAGREGKGAGAVRFDGRAGFPWRPLRALAVAGVVAVVGLSGCLAQPEDRDTRAEAPTAPAGWPAIVWPED